LDCLLPSHPQLESLPAPSESSVTPAATLNRALVVKGILDEELSHVLLKIHQGRSSSPAWIRKTSCSASFRAHTP
jgi:hypothetical protein